MSALENQLEEFFSTGPDIEEYEEFLDNLVLYRGLVDFKWVGLWLGYGAKNYFYTYIAIIFI